MQAISAINLADVQEDLLKYEVVGIDEGQFEMANQGKTVIIAALNGDYRQKPFQNITVLFSLAERIDKLSAVCRACGHSASFTFRTSHSAKRELIGGEELYQAVCRVCLFHQQNGTEKELSPAKELNPVKRMVSVENFELDPAKKRANA